MPAAAKVLVVDDELEVCRSLRRLLARSGLEVQIATGGSEGMKALEAELFDMVISDYRMPDINGAELLAEVARRSPRTLRLMLSACAEIDALARSIDEGHVFRFIRKPWNDAELSANILGLLHGQRALREVRSTLGAQPGAASEAYITEGSLVLSVRQNSGAFSARDAVALLTRLAGPIDAEAATLLELLLKSHGRIAVQANIGGELSFVLEAPLESTRSRVW